MVKMSEGKMQEPPGVRCSLFSRDNGCCDPTKRRYSMWGGCAVAIQRVED